MSANANENNNQQSALFRANTTRRRCLDDEESLVIKHKHVKLDEEYAGSAAVYNSDSSIPTVLLSASSSRTSDSRESAPSPRTSVSSFGELALSSSASTLSSRATAIASRLSASSSGATASTITQSQVQDRLTTSTTSSTLTLSSNSKLFLTGSKVRFGKRPLGKGVKYDQCQLLLPSKKQKVDLPVNEPERTMEEKRRNHIISDPTKVSNFVAQAVHRGGKNKLWSNHHHRSPTPVDSPFSFPWQRTPEYKAEPGVLNYILSKHPFPLGQGPLISPLDDDVQHQKVQMSPEEVFESRTVFQHCGTQECFEWIPSVTGIEAWNHENIQKVKLQKPEISMQGPCSKKTMAIVYTCNKQNCVVQCPCTVCNDEKSCKLFCRDMVCRKCNPQCLDHQIKLPRTFNPETDQYTLITNELEGYRYAIPYSGIPFDCKQCSEDLLEHQSYHLVFHTRCRFCRYDLRPFEQRSIVTFKEYKDCMEVVDFSDERTCEYCLVKSKSEMERIKHEEIMHKNLSKFKCKQCDKTYSNNTSLKYHMTTKHERNEEEKSFMCELCNSDFTSETSLSRHVETMHQQPAAINCETCGEVFSREDNLKRHMQEKHFDFNANLDFIEDVTHFKRHKCDECDKSFSRKDHLERHIKTVHSNEPKKQLDCSNCDVKFSSQSALVRHMKKQH